MPKKFYRIDPRCQKSRKIGNMNETAIGQPVRTRAVSDRLRTSNFHSWLMKTSLANAFAAVSCQTVQEFNLCCLNTNAPGCPY